MKKKFNVLYYSIFYVFKKELPPGILIYFYNIQTCYNYKYNCLNYKFIVIVILFENI